MQTQYSSALLLLLLPACSSTRTTRPPATIALPPPYTPTAPVPTLVRPTATSLPTPSPRQGIYFDPTASPAPVFGPLSPEGPWLVFQTQDQRILVADFTGSGLQLLPSPSDQDHPCEEINAIDSSPSSALLSFRCRTPALVDELWVISLPSGEVVARLPLLGEAALEADASPHESPFPWAPPAQSAIWWSDPVWSPSGRFLAYSAAPSSPSTDVHIYDISTRTTRRLTSGPNQALLLGWSPDSYWIVHASYLYGDIDMYVEALWAVSQDGSHLTKLYDVNDWVAHEGIVGWESPNEVITERFHFEACRTDLHSTVIGQPPRLLLPGGFSSVAYDPINSNALIAQSTEVFCSTDRPGLFVLNTDTGAYQQRASSGYWSVSWEPSLHAFLAKADAGQIDTISGSGERLASIADARFVAPSPDGKWLIATSDHGVALHASDGQIIVPSVSEDRSFAVWYPDSSKFAVFQCAPCSPGAAHLQVYSLEEGWHLDSDRQLRFVFANGDPILVKE
jgi:hypothetical protein